MESPSSEPLEGPSADASYADAEARSARLEEALHRDPGAHRVMTGDRPTGPLHLGHYFLVFRS
jgi:tryptophanyl-tRNA synthetase